MALNSIKIKDFCGIKELEINDFKRINVFVGKNSVGKTSVLDLILHKADNKLNFKLDPIMVNVGSFKKDLLKLLNKLFNVNIVNIYYDEGCKKHYFVFKNSEEQYELPCGRVSDGIKKVFVIFLDLYYYENGVLTIDDIETHLHFSIQKEFWKAVLKACKLYNVQLFTSTHSKEMIINLIESVDNEEVKIIKLIKNGFIEYDNEELAIKIERGIEIR